MHDHLPDAWLDAVVADLKAASTGPWGTGKPVVRALPKTVVRILRDNADLLEPKRRKDQLTQARAYIDKLINDGDEYSETLLLASEQLSEMLKRL